MHLNNVCIYTRSNINVQRNIFFPYIVILQVTHVVFAKKHLICAVFKSNSRDLVRFCDVLEANERKENATISECNKL